MKYRIGIISVLLLMMLFASCIVLAAPIAKNTIDLTGVWKFSIDPDNKGLDKGWENPGFNDAAWRGITVPGDWESQKVLKPNTNTGEIFSGYGWYRRSAVIPNEWKGKTLFLNVGEIFDTDWTYVNGTLVGKTVDGGRGLHRSYVIPSVAIKYGQPNTIVVRVLNTDTQGGMQDRPVSITTDQPDTPLQPVPQSPKVVHTRHDQDAVKVGATVTVAAGETVDDAVAVFGNVVVSGHVKGDAVAIGGTVTVMPGGRVDGSAVAPFGGISVTSGSIGGDAVALGGSIQNQNGTIGGQTVNIGGFQTGVIHPFPEESTSLFGWILASLVNNFVRSVIFALLAIAVLALFPKRVEIIADTSLGRTQTSALYGLVTFVLVLPVALLLLASCVGIPFVAVEAILVAVAWYLGKIGIALALGRRIADAAHRPELSPIWAVAIGIVVMGLIRSVPFAGWLVTFVLTIIGFGAVLLTGFGADSDWWNNRRQRRMAQQQTIPADTNEK